MGIEGQGSKPTGRIGRLIGMLMNGIHTNIYISYFDNKLPPNDSVILDIGCGGGRFIKYLSGKNCTYKLIGIDHSPEMVELSQKVTKNRPGAQRSQATILCASVMEMPIESDSVDLVTAFETVQFWPDISMSFSKIMRVLKRSGTFLIINRYPQEGSPWWERAQIKDDREYIEKLKSAGFHRVAVYLDYRKGWIVVTATK